MSLKFETDEAVAVGFPTGTFEKVEGKFGPQYLYTVEVNGLQDKLYASEKLHRGLQETGVKSGSRFVIVKEDKGNRTVWKVTPAGDRPSSPADAARASKQADSGSQETGASGSEALAGGLFGLAARCLRESLNAWRWLGENFTSDNVQATANTLFIACSDRGIVLPPIPYPDREQMEALTRIGDAIVLEQRAKLEKKVEEGITWVEAQAIIDYYEQKHGQTKKAA